MVINGSLGKVMKHVTKSGSFAGLLLLLLTAGIQARQFWEIRDSGLPYIAKIRADRVASAVVIYNPVICGEIGDACGFFREHAHAHDILNHPLYDPEDYTPTQEDKADCYAARTSRPDEVIAAVKLMESEAASNYPITGDPKRRASLIRECAKKAGNWTAEK